MQREGVSAVKCKLFKLEILVVSALIKGQMKQKQDSTALRLSFVSNTMILRRK